MERVTAIDAAQAATGQPQLRRPRRAGLVPLDAMRHVGPVLAGRIEWIAYPGGTWRYGIQAGRRRFVVDDPGCFAVGEKVGVVFARPVSAGS
ncbi:hypothetical protein [Arenibaculum pallidiluteum]|uniref:hypothetical protein n=1 Tax=Arenibaculum pallidiluteum TaxID=2812559 RepID=UPI001A958FF8|nr:hypothetical protein [Arenibaculum pallidiluteum]